MVIRAGVSNLVRAALRDPSSWRQAHRNLLATGPLVPLQARQSFGPEGSGLVLKGFKLVQQGRIPDQQELAVRGRKFLPETHFAQTDAWAVGRPGILAGMFNVIDYRPSRPAAKSTFWG